MSLACYGTISSEEGGMPSEMQILLKRYHFLGSERILIEIVEEAFGFLIILLLASDGSQG